MKWIKKQLDKLAMWWLKPNLKVDGDIYIVGECHINSVNFEMVGNSMVWILPKGSHICTTSCRTAKCVKARKEKDNAKE